MTVTNQPPLFPDLADVDPTPTDLDVAFSKFHAANPAVYELLVARARIARRSGHRRIGLALLYQGVRWDLSGVQWSALDTFRLNNDFCSRYARLIMAQESDLDGIFELRELRS